jgi:hypothetical protein
MYLIINDKGYTMTEGDVQPIMKISENGNTFWMLHGNLHREDGPARVWPTGCKEWWQDNKRHRTDGPAIEYADGDKSWYLHGELLFFDEWLQNNELTDGEKVMYKLEYG